VQFNQQPKQQKSLNYNIQTANRQQPSKDYYSRQQFNYYNQYGHLNKQRQYNKQLQYNNYNKSNEQRDFNIQQHQSPRMNNQWPQRYNNYYNNNSHQKYNNNSHQRYLNDRNQSSWTQNQYNKHYQLDSDFNQNNNISLQSIHTDTSTRQYQQPESVLTNLVNQIGRLIYQQTFNQQYYQHL
jgi:hypothetical protein